jgi:hypothetical protein
MTLLDHVRSGLSLGQPIPLPPTGEIRTIEWRGTWHYRWSGLEWQVTNGTVKARARKLRIALWLASFQAERR